MTARRSEPPLTTWGDWVPTAFIFVFFALVPLVVALLDLLR